MVKNLPYNARDVGSIPGQGTKDPTCHRAIKPTCHNYLACVPQLDSPRASNYRAQAPWSLLPQLEKRKPERHN